MAIKRATYISVWDGGFEIHSKCKVDTVSKRVFDIEIVDVGDNVDILDYEYVVIDGEKHSVDSYEGLYF